MINYSKYIEKYHPHSQEFLQAVSEVFEDVGDIFKNCTDYKENAIDERLLEPDRVIRFRVCWEDDSGKIQTNRAWRVQFNNALGAYKGGIRFHPSVNEDILKFLAFEQCFKNALTGLPMGGAKGGSDFDPKDKSKREIMRFCHSFMDELYRHIGPQVDVPAGDINVGSREIGYLYGRYLKLTNRWEGALTGKSLNFGGSSTREEATGYGVVYFLKTLLEAHDEHLKDRSVAISGAGNVAIYTAEKCIHEKAKVLSLSDSGGTLYIEKGLTEDQLEKVKKEKLQNRGSLENLNFGEYKKGKNPWTIENADIAIPCATQNEIDKDSAKTLIKNDYKVVIEGANMPVTSAAQKAIINANLIFAPAKAANAGGVAVSGLERSQNASLTHWSREKVDEQLQEIMQMIHGRCIENIEKKNGIYPYRKGANIYSFKKLADTLIAYGLK